MRNSRERGPFKLPRDNQFLLDVTADFPATQKRNPEENRRMRHAIVAYSEATAVFIGLGSWIVAVHTAIYKAPSEIGVVTIGGSGVLATAAILYCTAKNRFLRTKATGSSSDITYS